MNYNPENRVDTLASVTLNGHNHVIIERLGISIPRPYMKHDTIKGKTYVFGKGGIQIQELCDTCRKEEYKNTIFIEFFKEHDTDASPDESADKLYEKLKKKTTNVPVDIQKMILPNSHIDQHNTHPNSEYIIFRGNTERKFTLEKLLIQ